MRIVIPEGAQFVQKPEHLDPLRRLGELVVSPGHPKDKAADPASYVGPSVNSGMSCTSCHPGQTAPHYGTAQ